jgi:hypothetical protein
MGEFRLLYLLCCVFQYRCILYNSACEPGRLEICACSDTSGGGFLDV